MKENERPAHKERGYLLHMPDGTFVFRVYISADRKEWKDYQIRHMDLEVEIVDNYSSFFDTAPFKDGGVTEYDGYIGYPSRLTEKDVTTGDSVVK